MALLATRRRMAVASLGVVLLASKYAPAEAQGTSPARAGRLDTLVVAAEDTTQRYAAYVPATYDPARRWPVLLVLDPRGRARVALELFRPAAERLGVIVLSSYDSRSDTSDADVNVRAVNALLASAQARFSVDLRRLYLAGFSGTARDALRFALELRGQVAGVIGVGAGSEIQQQVLARVGAGGPPFAYYAAAGIDDFNHDEVRALAERLAGAHVPVRLAVFDGPHAWPPADVCGDALAWLMLRAIRDGLAPPDAAWIDARLRAELSSAGALDSSGKWEGASRLYAAIVRDYSPLPLSVDAGARAAAIESREPMRRLRARMRELAEEERQQAVEVQAGLLWLHTQRDAPGAGELSKRLGVAALLRRAAARDSLEAPSARRSLARIGALVSFYEPRWYVARGDLGKAALLLEVAASIAPLRGEACDQLDALRRRSPKAIGHGLDAQCR